MRASTGRRAGLFSALLFAWVVVVSTSCGGAAAPPASRPRSPQSVGVSPRGASAAAVVVSGKNDVEDDVVVEPPVGRTSTASSSSHPLAHVSDADLEQLIDTAPNELGAMSIGSPNSGVLFNAVQMPPGRHWQLNDADNAWGTEETIEFLSRSLEAVFETYPDAHPLVIGHISARRGGHLSPHKSHRTGRDVDLGYFYTTGPRWYARAHAGNLDVEKTWAFVKSLITETDVNFILIDSSLQALLRKYALESGEDAAWVGDVFEGKGSRGGALIRHAPGHATHMHVRFYNPIAQQTARRCYRALVRSGQIEPLAHYVSHRARKGDTLGKLAKRYHVSVPEIRRANALRSNRIRAGKTYRIPRAAEDLELPPPPVVPPRRLPPERTSERVGNARVPGGSTGG